MCGFTGIALAENKRVDSSLIREMGQVIKHRGPDDKGEVIINTKNNEHLNNVIGNIGFAFRRLSIIDLTYSGHQPMSNHDSSIWIMFNGEIYNAPELRDEVSKKYNQKFKGQSDTEVILSLYEKEGAGAFKKLNGMFAITIWDQKKKNLILARDRLGIKPLYYSHINDELVFSSEIKAIYKYPKIPKKVNLFATLEYFTFQYSLGDKTMYNDIKLVKPGEYLVFSIDKNKVALKKNSKFWSLNFNNINHNNSIDNFADELHHILKNSLKRQVRSDVEIGSFLSSGIDTGSITTLASQIIPNLKTFTCGFDIPNSSDSLESFFDERNDARKMAKLLGTDHYEISLAAQDLSEELLKKVIWHLEDSRVGISYQIYSIAQKVKQHVSVVLSGTGGDELFAGYHWRYDKILQCKDINNFDDIYYNLWSRILNDSNRWEIFSDNVKKETDNFSPRQSYNEIMKEADIDDPLNRALYFDIKGFLHGLLIVDDKLNMAHSLESRVPLLDNDIIDFALKIPSHMKYDGQTTKKILKKALKGILPDEVINRRKQGFTPPAASLFRGEFSKYINSILLSERFLERGIFKAKGIEKILTEHASQKHNHRFLIWSLLCFEWQNRIFLD